MGRSSSRFICADHFYFVRMDRSDSPRSPQSVDYALEQKISGLLDVKVTRFLVCKTVETCNGRSVIEELLLGSLVACDVGSL